MTFTAPVNRLNLNRTRKAGAIIESNHSQSFPYNKYAKISCIIKLNLTESQLYENYINDFRNDRTNFLKFQTSWINKKQ